MNPQAQTPQPNAGKYTFNGGVNALGQTYQQVFGSGTSLPQVGAQAPQIAPQAPQMAQPGLPQAPGAPQLGTGYASTPTSPLVPTNPINLNPSPVTDTNITTGPRTSYQDIQALLKRNQELQDKYLQSLQPSQEELSIQGQLAGVRQEFDNFQTSLMQGQKQQFGLGRPLELSTGRAQQLADNSKLTSIDFGNQEKNLLTRLGIAQSTRQAQTEALGAAAKFGREDLNTAVQMEQQVYERLRQQDNDVFNRFVQMNDIQRKDASDILSSLQGVDPDTLSPEARLKIAQVAEQRGIPSDAIFSSMRNSYLKGQADMVYKQQQTASLLGGDTGLNSKQTQNFLAITTKFQADPFINNALKGTTAIQIADQVLANPKSATNQLKSLYSLVKNLDPDSAVREGELSLAEKTQSFFQNFQSSITRISEGRVISPEAATALANATKELAGAWVETASRRTQQYSAQAAGAGIADAFNEYLGASNLPLQQNNPGGQIAKQIDEALSSGHSPGDVIHYLLNNSPVKDQILEAQRNQYTPEQILDYLRKGSTGGVSIQIPESSKLSYINNNPGNLRYAGQPGATPGKGGFAQFKSPEAGFKAIVDQLGIYTRKGMTLAKAIDTYAPPTENDTKTYVAQISNWLGVSPTTPLKDIDHVLLAKAIAKKESSARIS